MRAKLLNKPERKTWTYNKGGILEKQYILKYNTKVANGIMDASNYI